MQNRLSRYYCQYSGIMIGFGLVFMFLFGIRSYSIWQQWLPSGLALLVSLFMALLFSCTTYFLLNVLSLRLFRRIGGVPSTCSR